MYGVPGVAVAIGAKWNGPKSRRPLVGAGEESPLGAGRGHGLYVGYLGGTGPPAPEAGVGSHNLIEPLKRPHL